MIIKRFEQYNESLLNKIEGPNQDEYFEALKKLRPSDMLTKSIQDNFIEGIKYVIDNYIDKINWLMTLQYAAIYDKKESVQFLLDNIDYDAKSINIVLKSAIKDDIKLILNNFINKLSFLEESLLNKISGLSEEEVDKNLNSMSPYKALEKSLSIEYKQGILNALHRDKDAIDEVYPEEAIRIIELLGIENNLDKMIELLNTETIYDYSVNVGFKEGILYSIKELDKTPSNILESIFLEDVYVEYDRIDVLEYLIKNGLDITNISVDDIYYICNEFPDESLGLIFAKYISEQKTIDRLLIEFTYSSMQTPNLIFEAFLKKNPSQSALDEALEKLTEYVEDISSYSEYYYVSKLLLAGAKTSTEKLEEISELKNGDKDDVKVYNLFKKYFNI